MTLRVLIDTDPGTDDALALMMALGSSELVIEGITTVAGNATLAHTTRNALRLLDYLGGPDVPVYRGAARPLRGRFHYGYYFHGAAGLGVRLPSPRRRPQPARAPELIARSVSSSPGELALIAPGPLTNIARALRLEPRLAGWTREIVVMGGAVGVSGNVTPHAEFNIYNDIYNDPTAADIVLSSGIPTTLVGLDVCLQTYVGRDDLPWPSGRSKKAQLANLVLSNWFRSHPERDRYELCDPLAVAAAIRPDLLQDRTARVAVETKDAVRLGKTVAEYGSGHVRVAVGVDVGRAKGLIMGLLT